jgi:hypothetical protein
MSRIRFDKYTGKILVELDYLNIKKTIKNYSDKIAILREEFIAIKEEKELAAIQSLHHSWTHVVGGNTNSTSLLKVDAVIQEEIEEEAE